MPMSDRSIASARLDTSTHRTLENVLHAFRDAQNVMR